MQQKKTDKITSLYSLFEHSSSGSRSALGPHETLSGVGIMFRRAITASTPLCSTDLPVHDAAGARTLRGGNLDAEHSVVSRERGAKTSTCAVGLARSPQRPQIAPIWRGEGASLWRRALALALAPEHRGRNGPRVDLPHRSGLRATRTTARPAGRTPPSSHHTSRAARRSTTGAHVAHDVPSIFAQALSV